MVSSTLSTNMIKIQEEAKCEEMQLVDYSDYEMYKSFIQPEWVYSSKGNPDKATFWKINEIRAQYEFYEMKNHFDYRNKILSLFSLIKSKILFTTRSNYEYEEKLLEKKKKP